MTAIFDPQAAARILLEARAGGARPTGMPDGPARPGNAYAVQAEVMRALGCPVSWKMALLCGKDRHTAAMPASEIYRSGATLTGLPPDAAIEVETALVLGTDLRPGGTVGTALDAVAELRLAFEIIGSRYADRTKVPPLAAMADSFSSAGIVLGDAIPDWRAALDRPLGLTLKLNDKDVPAVEQSLGLDQTGDFLMWLAQHAAEQRLPLLAGTVIITGARIGPISLAGVGVAVGRCVTAEVRAVFSAPDISR